MVTAIPELRTTGRVGVGVIDAYNRGPTLSIASGPGTGGPSNSPTACWMT